MPGVLGRAGSVPAAPRDAAIGVAPAPGSSKPGRAGTGAESVVAGTASAAGTAGAGNGEGAAGAVTPPGLWKGELSEPTGRARESRPIAESVEVPRSLARVGLAALAGGSDALAALAAGSSG